MPGEDLLQALSRLDQAIGRLETHGNALIGRVIQKDGERTAAMKAAIAEIDTVLGALGHHARTERG